MKTIIGGRPYAILERKCLRFYQFQSIIGFFKEVPPDGYAL
jgi:hypothetical protein